jgi:hypothetical protein
MYRLADALVLTDGGAHGADAASSGHIECPTTLAYATEAAMAITTVTTITSIKVNPRCGIIWRSPARGDSPS